MKIKLLKKIRKILKISREDETGSVFVWCFVFMFVALTVLQMTFSMASLISRHEVDSALEAATLAALSRNQTNLSGGGGSGGVDFGGTLTITGGGSATDITLASDATDVAKKVFNANLPNPKMATCDMTTFKVELIDETNLWTKYKTKKVRVSVKVTYHKLFIVKGNRDITVTAISDAVLSKKAID